MYRKTIIVAALILSMFCVNAEAGVKPHKHVKHHNVVKREKKEENSSSMVCLAKTIYYEARGESEEGKRWVAHSVINRTKHPKFPKDVCSVISERHRGVCQFSWYCGGSRIHHDASWEDSLRVAEEALSGRNVNPKLNKVLFFHSVKTRPTWGRKYKRIERVDNHIFYGEL